MQVCFVVCPDAPMLDMALTRHVLEHANRAAGRPLITFRTRTLTGEPVATAEGARLFPDAKGWDRGPGLDLILVFAGQSPLARIPFGLRGFLLDADRIGATIGGIGSGTQILAELGLLAGREAVLSGPLPQDRDPLWPDIARTQAPFVLARQRLTTPGGLTVIDSLLAWLSRAIAPELAAEIRRAALNGAALPSRPKNEETADPLLSRMESVMSAHIDTPLPLSAIARELDLSPKQMRHRCQTGLGKTPSQVYLDLRLARARRLVQETGQTVHEIAKATGFVSPSAFTRSYKSHYGETPRALRASKRQSVSRGRAYTSPALQGSP
ncbi:GlxA family transcriptional regulator [Primorskyibacter sp. 2E107]|uniref:GlxA family transcriptional regulator n=1 Tax=Primorskyibacter sp. 2E107 TaxID=3403458 RepID=UPI003AF6FB90